MQLFILGAVLVTLTTCHEKREIVMGLPGGIYPGNLEDPEVMEAVKHALVDFKRRALKNERLGDGDAIVVGDVVDVQQQVVAGMKYIVKLKVGVTSECAEKATDGFLKAGVCSKADSDLGLHTIEVVHQPWMEVKYLFTKFEDNSGPKLAAYWKESE